jgi:esterase/lipase superfamily enzyme
MRTLRFLSLAAAIVLASATPLWAQQMSPELVRQLQDLEVQKQLIALGVLDATAGHVSSKELGKAVDRFRKAYKSTRGMAPLDNDEKTKLKQAKDKFDAATGLKELTYKDPNLKTKTDITLLVPLKFVGETPEKRDEKAPDGWREYRSKDGKTAVGPVIRLLSDVTPIALFRENVMRVSLDYKHLHLSSEEFTAVGSSSDNGGYFSANKVLSAKDMLKGLFMRYPESPPDTFIEVPDFLVPVVGSAPESKAKAWQLLMQGFANLAMSEFPQENGWKLVDATPCSHRPSNVGQGSIRVFFGTDRKEKSTAVTERDKAGPVADPDSLFENKPGNRLHIGCAYVVPPTKEEVKKSGDLSGSDIAWYQALYSTPKADLGDHLILANELAESAPDATQVRRRLSRLVKARADESTRSSALLFIHGYNVSFKDALFTVAQIASRTEYRGRAYMYSWPSAASMFGYVADMDDAEQAQPFLQSFLKLLMRDADIDDIDILVHSMGSQTALRALSALQSVFETERPDNRKMRIGQLMFAAPDVAAPVFDQKIRRIAPHADRITVYASMTDAALLASKLLRSGALRVGALNDDLPILVEVRNVHVIDATGKERWWRLDRILQGYGHDYFLQNESVRTDIRRILGNSQSDDREDPDLRSKDLFDKMPFAGKDKEPAPGQDAWYFWKLKK